MRDPYYSLPRPSWYPDHASWVLSWVANVMAVVTVLLAVFVTDNEWLRWTMIPAAGLVALMNLSIYWLVAIGKLR